MNKNVLVAGGAGYIGSHTVNLLIKNGKLISINIDRRVKILNNTIGYLSFIIINNLIVENPKFFLEIAEINKNSSKTSRSSL